MYIQELAQAAAVFAVAVGLSAWRVFAAVGQSNKGVDRLLGATTAIAAVWMVLAVLALESTLRVL